MTNEQRAIRELLSAVTDMARFLEQGMVRADGRPTPSDASIIMQPVWDAIWEARKCMVSCENGVNDDPNRQKVFLPQTLRSAD